MPGNANVAENRLPGMPPREWRELMAALKPDDGGVGS